MRKFHFQKSQIVFFLFIIFFISLFIYVFLTTGPFAPMGIVTEKVERKTLQPLLFGIGSVEARRTYKIAPLFTARLESLDFDVGDKVKAGQLLAKMESFTLSERILSQEAAIREAEASYLEAKEVERYARSENLRYKALLKDKAVSEEKARLREQEFLLAKAALLVQEKRILRLKAEKEVLKAEERNLFLSAPADGFIISRDFEPGSTVLAGQSILTMAGEELWLKLRFDQINAGGLRAGLKAEVNLRSQKERKLAASVFRVEPLGDLVTEEIIAKLSFDEVPEPLPVIGELVEARLELDKIEDSLFIPYTALHYIKNQPGVWRYKDKKLSFVPVKLGLSDLKADVEVLEGLLPGDEIVVYSEKSLNRRSRVYKKDSILEES